MKQSINTSSIGETVTVNVLVNNDRQKKFPTASDSNPIIYLKDQDEFSLEFMSSFKETIGITIEMNGKLLSDRKLILNPGQRVVLDRYIETPKTFKFTEYDLGNKNDELTSIAKDVYESSKMGQILINVYKEQTLKLSNTGSGTWPYINSSQPYNREVWINDFYYPFQSSFPPNEQILYTSDINQVTTDNLENTFISDDYNPTKDYSSNNFYSYVEENNQTLGLPEKSPKILYKSLVEEKPEQEKAGKISEGKKSNSTFTTEEIYFDNYITTTVKLRLKPISTKPITNQDLKRFCTSCGRGANQKHKYCGNCGNKL